MSRNADERLMMQSAGLTYGVDREVGMPYSSSGLDSLRKDYDEEKRKELRKRFKDYCNQIKWRLTPDEMLKYENFFINLVMNNDKDQTNQTIKGMQSQIDVKKQEINKIMDKIDNDERVIANYKKEIAELKKKSCGILGEIGNIQTYMKRLIKKNQAKSKFFKNKKFENFLNKEVKL